MESRKVQKAVNETPEERARRLGLTGGETPEQRAERLGLTGSGQRMTEMIREQPGGRMGIPQESVRLDVRQPGESTRALPYDPTRNTEFEGLIGGQMKGFIPGIAKVAPEAARGGAALALSATQIAPGMERFQAAMGSLGSKFTDSPMSYGESRDALRSETDKIPGEVKAALQVATGAGLAKLPALAKVSPAKSGMAIGAADQALSADDMDITERAGRTVALAGAGGLAGKVFDTGATALRAASTPRIDANVMGRQAAVRADDKINYALAMAEGGPGAHGAVQQVLANPDIAPYAAIVRSNPKLRTASDARVLHETYKLLSREGTGVNQRLTRDGFDAMLSQKADRIGAMKEELLNAADQIMPSYRAAVQSHAKGKAGIEAVKVGKQAATRAISKTSSARPETQSAQALTQRIKRMSPEDRQAAIEGILGRLRETIGVQPNAVSMGGALTTAIRPARVSSMLREIGGGNQEMIDQIQRMALMMAAGQIP